LFSINQSFERSLKKGIGCRAIAVDRFRFVRPKSVAKATRLEIFIATTQDLVRYRFERDNKELEAWRENLEEEYKTKTAPSSN